MGTLVFQATLGGQVNLTGPNTASTFTISVPAVTGNMITSGDTGTVTNTMLAGSIANAKLLNSSVTIGSTAISLGATSTTLDGVNIGATTPGTGAFTTLSASSTTTLSGGTANGVAYLNGSKVVTTGSALTFDGTNLSVGVATPQGRIHSQITTPATGAVSTPIFYGGDGSKQFQLLQTGATYNTFGAGANELWYYTASYAALTFGSDGNIPIKWVSNGSEQMRLTSTGLGIGTSSPADKLEVYSTITARAGSGTSALRLRNTTSDYQWQTVAGTNAVVLFDNAVGSARLTLDSSGNLGLGVTPSAWSTLTGFDINTWGAVSAYTNQINVSSNAYYNGGWKYKQTNYATRYEQNSTGIHAWFTAPSGTAGNAITFTQAMTLNAAGDLGLGTTSPVSVGVSGMPAMTFASATSGRSGATYWADTGGNNSAYAYFYGNEFNFGTGTSHPIKFVTVGTERARITSGGNFLVGTTAVPSSSVAGICLTGTSSGNISSSGSATTAYNHWLFENGNGIVGSISTSGSLTTYSVSSDYRLKNITGPVLGPEAKNFIMALQPKQGSWKADGSKFVGFVADEFQAVSPSSVVGTKDAVDENGNPVMQAMQASSPEVMANLIAHIQYLETRLAALEAK
jgi:hypothetical protein